MFKYLGQRFVSIMCSSATRCFNTVMMTSEESDETSEQFLHPFLPNHSSTTAPKSKYVENYRASDVTLADSTDLCSYTYIHICG